MYWEAQGKYEQAEEIYKDMLKDQPTNETAAKRMVREHEHLPVEHPHRQTHPGH